MKIVIEGKNIDLTGALKDYVNEKLKRLSNHYESIIKGHDVKVKLSVAKNPRIKEHNICEVTIFLNGKIIRSEESTPDMYASIDLVTDKLNRQIEKYKTRVYRSYQHNQKPKVTNTEELIPNDLVLENLLNGKIIKTKKFKLHPMSPEEAVHHLSLIGHDFYVFVNSKSQEINVVYERKDGAYGLIEPQ